MLSGENGRRHAQAGKLINGSDWLEYTQKRGSIPQFDFWNDAEAKIETRWDEFVNLSSRVRKGKSGFLFLDEK